MNGLELLRILAYKWMPFKIQRNLLQPIMKILKRTDSLSLVLIFALHLFTTCKSDVVKINYVISREDSIKRAISTRSDGVVLMPPTVEYSRFNFFIDSKGYLYYFAFSEPVKTLGVVDELDPSTLSLIRGNLIKVLKGEEVSFFKREVVDKKIAEKIKTITIASEADTIKGDFGNYLMKLKSSSNSNISLNIRRTFKSELNR